jgi:orotidine-5'-phosphate decarboxylase
MPRPAHLRTYGDRAENATNPTARLLLQTMERKKTNLAVSVDVTTSVDFLSIIEAVGPYVCLIKASVSNRSAKTYLVLTFTSRLI